MADIMVVLIVIVLLGFALRGAIRHFKGDSPCCERRQFISKV